jgi:hypothetical protein
MTAFSSDTRQDQILRGEVWFGAGQQTIQETTTGDELSITTDVNEVQLNMEFISRAPMEISLWSGPTISVQGSPKPNSNMRLSSAETTNVVLKGSPTVTDPGSNIVLYEQKEDTQKVISPFTEGSGIILDASTTYIIWFVNLSTRSARVDYSWFFREI